MFGRVYQNGYVVTDLSAAIDRWLALGVGPFYRLPIQFESYVHRGVKSNPTLDVAIANSGDLQIELIQQTNDAPSAYLEFATGHGSGLQHISALSDDLDRDMARWREGGLQLVTECVIAGGTRAIFYDTDLPDGTGMQMEVLELTDGVRQGIDHIRTAAIDWDGIDPVRHMKI